MDIRKYRPSKPVFIAVTIALLILGWLLGQFLGSLPPVEKLNRSHYSHASIVYASDGEVITRYYEQNRTWAPLDSIAPSAVAALLVTEDAKFYWHDGIDVQRTVGAVWNTLLGRQQGGSTLTMQLARNAFTELQQDPILVRKMKEWVTALRLEGRYSKNQILEMYFNSVPFLYNAYGIEAAAQTYFDKSALELNPLESATLVGMLKGPSVYNPKLHPEASRQRRNIVLRLMHESGYLSSEQYESFIKQPIRLHFNPTTPENNLAPYFSEHVRQQLSAWARKRGYDLYKDGLRVYTTLDSRMQRAAEASLKSTIEDLQAVVDVSWSQRSAPLMSTGFASYKKQREHVQPFAYFWEGRSELVDRLVRNSDRYRQLVADGVPARQAFKSLRNDEAFVTSIKNAASRLQGGFIAIDPSNGHVKAWVGGSSFADNKYDHVVQARRQPGSTFKPFVYAAALASGMSPDDALPDRRFSYVNHITGDVWEPGNFEGETGRPYTLRKALAYSKNTVTAQLVMRVGPERVAAYARQMGIKSDLQAVPSIGLGTSELTLYELTSAYTTLAAYGHRTEPMFITRIEDRQGKVLARFATPSRQVISPRVAAGVLDMMKGVVDYGTGVRIRSQYGVHGELAGKTGTTQRSADGWFMLIHPSLVVGSWVGFDQPELTFRTDWWGQGAHTALHMVGRFMKQVDLPKQSFARVPDVEFDDNTFLASAKTAEGSGWQSSRAIDLSWRNLSPTDRLNRSERRSSDVARLLKKIRGPEG